MAIVGAPAYFARRPVPASVQDLIKHDCINLRLASKGGLYAWELRQEGRDIEVQVRGRLVFNGIYQILNAALSGCGLGFVPADLAEPHIRAGQLKSVMEAFCPSFPGLHAYYPSRRQNSRALALVIETIRHKG